jgi:hypothetical protein
MNRRVLKNLFNQPKEVNWKTKFDKIAITENNNKIEKIRHKIMEATEINILLLLLARKRIALLWDHTMLPNEFEYYERNYDTGPYLE